MILVFGASGKIGGELISLFPAEGVPAIAVTRAPSGRPLPGVRWAQADLPQPASIDGLCSGITSMFLLTGNHPDMARLQITAIHAAAAAGVEYVVKLSALGASGPEALSYHDIARILSNVIQRPVEYHDLSLNDARDLTTLAAHQRAGGKTAMVHDSVHQILRRAPRSFAQFATDHADIFRSGHAEGEFEVRS